MTTVKIRDINLDLVRCAALLMVPIMHSLDHTGLYEQLLYSWPDRLMIAVKTLFTCCIPLYVMLSGYLNNKKRLSARYYLGLIRIVVTYLICGGACLIFEQLSGIARRSPREMLSALLNYSCCDYAWYIMMYLGLFLLIPFINAAWRGVDRAGRLALTASLVCMAILPSAANLSRYTDAQVQLVPGWWEKLYPLAYYCLGAWLREHPRRDGLMKCSGFMIRNKVCTIETLNLRRLPEGSLLSDCRQSPRFTPGLFYCSYQHFNDSSGFYQEKFPTYQL